VHQYQASALDNPNLLVANLELIAGGLMEVSLRIEDVLTAALASQPATLGTVHKLAPALEAYLKLTPQVDRIAQVCQQARVPPENTRETLAAVRRLGARKPLESEELQG
jgi:hypothetical protein